MSTIEQRTSLYNREDVEHKEIIKNSASYCPSFSLIFSQPLKSWLGVEYGFAVSRQEQAYKIYRFPEATGRGLEGGKKLLYLKIPILASVRLISNPKNVLFVAAGPQFGALLSEDGTIPLYTGATPGVASDTLDRFDIIEAAGAYKWFVLDVAGSVGWRTKVYKNFFLQFQLRADYSLTDIEDKSYDALVIGTVVSQNLHYAYSLKRPATHSMAIGFGMGLCWKFR